VQRVINMSVDDEHLQTSLIHLYISALRTIDYGDEQEKMTVITQ
jgi:hypothetical protein